MYTSKKRFRKIFYNSQQYSNSNWSKSKLINARIDHQPYIKFISKTDMYLPIKIDLSSSVRRDQLFIF